MWLNSSLYFGYSIKSQLTQALTALYVLIWNIFLLYIPMLKSLEFYVTFGKEGVSFVALAVLYLLTGIE